MLISSEVKALILFSSPFAYSEVFSLVLSLFFSLGLHVLIHTWLTEQYWPFLGPSCFSRVCHRIGISAHTSIGQKHSQLSGIWSTHCRLKCFSRFRFLLIQFNLAAFYLLVLGFFLSSFFFRLLWGAGAALLKDLQKELLELFLFLVCFLLQLSHTK